MQRIKNILMLEVLPVIALNIIIKILTIKVSIKSNFFSIWPHMKVNFSETSCSIGSRLMHGVLLKSYTGYINLIKITFYC